MKQYIGKLVKENNYYGALLLIILFELVVLFILGYVLLNHFKTKYSLEVKQSSSRFLIEQTTSERG